MTSIVNHVSEVRMLGDRILLKPLDWEPSKIISVVRKGRPVRGAVMAVGPGIHPMKYKPHPDGKRRIVEYQKRFQRTEVKVGDTVELGGLNIFDGQGYQFPEVVVGNETMIVVTERDVAGIVERDGEPTRTTSYLDGQPLEFTRADVLLAEEACRLKRTEEKLDGKA